MGGDIGHYFFSRDSRALRARLAGQGACLLSLPGFVKSLSPIGEHSAKPQEARRRIERLLLGPYLELFARSPADGWVTWGNEINQTVVRVPHAAFRQPGRDWSRTRPAAINGAPGSATPRPAFCHDSTLTPNPASSGASKWPHFLPVSPV
jgi:hypothetical protein